MEVFAICTAGGLDECTRSCCPILGPHRLVEHVLISAIDNVDNVDNAILSTNDTSLSWAVKSRKGSATLKLTVTKQKIGMAKKMKQQLYPCKSSLVKFMEITYIRCLTSASVKYLLVQAIEKTEVSSGFLFQSKEETIMHLHSWYPEKERALHDLNPHPVVQHFQ